MTVYPADEALQRLLAGNQRYMQGNPLHPNQALPRRSEISAGQKPFATILGCVDSRVPPELIFDCGLGDLFVIRTAGQALDKTVIGSLEFGVAELHIPLLVVLGHTRCGAVLATLEILSGHAHAEGDISALVEAVRPAVEQAQGLPGDLVQNTVLKNIELDLARLKASPVLAEAVHKGELKIVGACYDLISGAVEIVVP